MAKQAKTVRPRKTPRQERSQRTVEAILIAAAQVFADQGYAATTTNHIAVRAGVSIGSLYQYFPSKDAILLALAERHVEVAFAKVLETVREKREAPVSELLRALVDALVEGHQFDPGLHRAIFEETHPDRKFRARLDELDERAVRLARDLIEERCAELAVDNLEMASMLCVQILEGVTHVMAIRYPEMLATQEFRDELVKVLEGYLLGGRRGAVEEERYGVMRS
jgi:AcrR family transcriptional regulator